MKNLANTILISLALLLLSSCGGPKEKVLKLEAPGISGEISEYFKIADGNYVLKEAEYYQTYLTLNFELIKKFDKYDGIDFIFHSMKLKLLDENGSPLFGMNFITTDSEDLKSLLHSNVGETKSITFMQISDEKGVDRIFDEAVAFSVGGIDITKSEVEPDKLPLDLFGEWFGLVDKNIFSLKFGKSSKKRLFIRGDDDFIFEKIHFSIWKNTITVDFNGKEEKFNYSFEKGNQILVLQSTTNEYKIRLAKNKNALNEIEPVS